MASATRTQGMNKTKPAVKAGPNAKLVHVGDLPQASMDFINVKVPTLSIKELNESNVLTQKEMIGGDVKRTNALVRVPIGKIRVKKGFNLRKDFGDIEALASNIELVGRLVKPIQVDAYRDADGEVFYILTDGERRFKALLHLTNSSPELAERFAYVDAIVNPRDTTEKERMMMMFISNSGKSFDPIEEAEGFKTMRDKYEMAPIEIARGSMNSIAYVEQRLLLADASPEEKQMVKEGKVSSTALVDLSRKEKDPVKRTAAIKEATKDGGKVKVKHLKNKPHIDLIDEALALIKKADRLNKNEDVRAMLYDVDEKIRELKKNLK